MIEERTLSHEKTILVGVINSRQNIEQVKEYLDEKKLFIQHHMIHYYTTQIKTNILQ